jgi:hypothetical protein
MMHDDVMPGRHSERDTAEKLGISVWSLRRLERAGEIRSFRPSPQKVWYLDPDIADFVNGRAIQRRQASAIADGLNRS